MEKHCLNIEGAGSSGAALLEYLKVLVLVDQHFSHLIYHTNLQSSTNWWQERDGWGRDSGWKWGDDGDGEWVLTYSIIVRSIYIGGFLYHFMVVMTSSYDFWSWEDNTLKIFLLYHDDFAFNMVL